MNNFFKSYIPIVGEKTVEQLLKTANKLHGKKIVHVNSTAEGGGVAEILKTMIPFFNALGIDTKWHVIQGNDTFFKCTKYFHNGLQGKKTDCDKHLLQEYETVNKNNALLLQDTLVQADFIFIHDPQPLPLITYFPHRHNKWFWRCHIDTGHPNKFIWKYLKNYIRQYDATIFSLADFAHPFSNPTYIIPPSIDPLSEKNKDIDEIEVRSTCQEMGIDISRPKILQVSRFDHFKDPLGVIKAYVLAKKYYPDIQLILTGSEASDDPEGKDVLAQVLKEASSDVDIHVFCLPANAHRTINMLQRAADIVMQKSLREGFGLTVTEALWKNKPVIGGNTGGIRLQIINNYNGFLINTPEEAADNICFLLQNPNNMKALGIRGKEHVRNKFLITRHINDYLKLMTDFCK